MTSTARRPPPAAALLLAALLTAGCSARALAPETPASASVGAALPPTLQGRWVPVSLALEGPGALTLSARTLAWAPCGPAARTIRAETSAAAMLLTLPGQPACRLDGQPVTHLRVAPRSSNACEMELSLYESAAQLTRQERLAWGVYTRTGCQGGAR